MPITMNFQMKLYMDNMGRRQREADRAAEGKKSILRLTERTVRFVARYFAVCMLLSAALFSALPFANGQNDANLFPPKPEPAVYVHDYAGWLSPGQKGMLEEKLRRYWDSTSTQVVVMIRPDIGDYDKSSYAFELGKRWGIGRADKDNGVVMLIKSEPPDRGIFIATGYGAEGALPDITAGRIIRNTMAPYFKAQRFYEGIDAGLNDIIRALSGEFKSGDKSSDDGDLPVLGLVFLIVFLIFAYSYYRAKRGAATYTHSGRSFRRSSHRDSPWGGGGGWIIGGGGGGGWESSGGSGGGWSDGGSFGGGDFGGGGAGGDW
jgi:uncharacterized protein